MDVLSLGAPDLVGSGVPSVEVLVAVQSVLEDLSEHPLAVLRPEQDFAEDGQNGPVQLLGGGGDDDWVGLFELVN